MSDSTIADVAAKTVDHLAEGIKSSGETVQKIAPHAWDIAVRQQRVQGLVDIAIGIVVAAALCVAIRLVCEFVQKLCVDDHDCGESVLAARLICSVIALVIGVPIFCSYSIGGVQMLSNPEYYAAKELLGAVK